MSGLNSSVEEVSEETKVTVSWINQVLTVGAAGSMLTYSIFKIYDDNEKGRLNPLNPQVEGREGTKLSGVFFSLIPLLAMKVLYHIYLLITKGGARSESDRFKTVRHLLGIFILLVAGVSLGLSEHPSSDYCYDLNRTHTDQAGATLVLKENVTLSNGDRINVKEHLQKCKIKNLVHGSGDDVVRYGEDYLTGLVLLFLGAICLRFFGIFQDNPQLKALISWTSTEEIHWIKYSILAGAAAIAVISATIARAEDLKEEVGGKRLLEDGDLLFFDFLLAFSWVHAIFIGAGLALKIFKDLLSNQSFQYSLLNNIPIVRGIVTTVTIACVAYITGAAAGLLIDYSFLSIALVAQVILDVFGRSKGDNL